MPGNARQREGDARQEQALANQTELLGMQKQLHGEKMGELNRANEERMRTDALGALSTNVESVYSDLPAYQRQQMVIDNGLKAGLFKPADLVPGCAWALAEIKIGRASCRERVSSPV